MSLAILFHFLCAQHVSDINISIIRVAGWSTLCSACNTDTTQTQPHQISDTQRTENNMTDMVIQQHSRKLLMMVILMPETCWAHKKWNKIASDIKLAFYSSTITMMQGPINIILTALCKAHKHSPKISLMQKAHVMFIPIKAALKQLQS